MKKIFAAVILIFLSSGVCPAQIKSFEDAQKEISLFDEPAAFSLAYDETKYLTAAEARLEILEEKNGLRKQFQKFEWQLSSFFAIKGIDKKPVRNTLCITTQSKQFAFSRENNLTVFLSEEDVNLGEPNRLSEIKRGKATEKMCWEVDKEIFRDFADQEKIEFQIGSLKLTVPASKIRIFKDFKKLLTVSDHDSK